jgi:hypothetical protein
VELILVDRCNDLGNVNDLMAVGIRVGADEGFAAFPASTWL